ncbi:MAG: hypothetical protein C4326_11945 [Ignavibacteria bacterium]
MNRHAVVCCALFVLSGCAAYKELSPKPELSPVERGYIELKDDEKYFMLEKDKKYYIKFPRPERNQFSLVLKLSSKRWLETYLTTSFEEEERTKRMVPDEAAGSDTMSVYAVDTSVPIYYWVIETVRNDGELVMQYRYVPRWRLTFENKYAQFQSMLANNMVDRSTYNTIDRSFDFAGFPFTERIALLNTTLANVQGLRSELDRLQSVFPPNIAATRDTAYEQYLALKNQTENELQFQQNYLKVLTVFSKERETQGNTAKFLASAPLFAEFLGESSRYPSPLLEKARDVFTRRMGDAPGYFDEQLRSKRDASKIVIDPPITHATMLYEALGVAVPNELKSMTQFVDRFNLEASAMQSVNERFRQIDKALAVSPPWASEAFYADVLGKIADIKARVPESRAAAFDRYGGYTCAMILDGDIRNATLRAEALERMFGLGQTFVQHLNANAWGTAEATMKELHLTPVPTGAAVADQKAKLVKALEAELFSRVKLASRERVDAFVKAHEAAIDNVPALYKDSAFLPVYDITFSTLGEAEVQRKRRDVQEYIDKLKFYDFPAASIRAIYRDFSRNINDKGVERARAIVEHGKYYKGDDKQLRAILNECDPTVAKWIVKPKEYRKLYALPITNNPRGSNEYLFRVQLQIPTEAQFPVFEVNIKLPEELAAKAATEQWFESITINKTPIRNEGRFTITAPTAENNYESQISPVQMDKEGKNILEVRFRYPGFRVFEVSTMAQVPIIRKN